MCTVCFCLVLLALLIKTWDSVHVVRQATTRELDTCAGAASYIVNIQLAGRKMIVPSGPWFVGATDLEFLKPGCEITAQTVRLVQKS